MRPKATLALALALLGLTLCPGLAVGAGPPQVPAAWVSKVTATGATLRAEINPEGALTRYRFEYLSEAAYEANLAASPPREGFAGALRAPASGSEPSVGAGTSPEEVNQHIGDLTALTTYRYRVRATSAQGTTFSSEAPYAHTFTTQGTELVFSLPDNRGWEMVSPVDKNGGAITSVGTTAPRVFQAAADGNSATYDSISAFAEPEGAPSVSQYLSKRVEGSWSTEDVTIPLFSGSYGDQPPTTPYQLFSGDLSRALVRGGERCRGEAGECVNANPPLPGSGAPAGYVNYYRRDASGGFSALLTQDDVAGLAVAPQNFEMELVATAPDLGAALLSTCAALTGAAVEAPAGPACDPAQPNLYEWSEAGLDLVSVPPGESKGVPGATIAAPAGAVSANGDRVYWVDQGSGAIYLWTRGLGSVLVSPGGAFQVASSDGSIAYLIEEGELYRFEAGAGTLTDLTPGDEVKGVLGISADGSRVYYEAATGLELWREGTMTPIAASGDSSNYPPATGTARVTPDGNHLAFLSRASLTGYDNAGKAEVFLYGPTAGSAASAVLRCVSCNPTGERPLGDSSIPGGISNGGALRYKPRSLSVDGTRVFFDSVDALVAQDTNEEFDAYEWEAPGEGACTEASGCVDLLSNGRSNEGSSFVDASANGSDAFILTDGSLVAGDPGLVDIYDVREGGGFPTPPTAIPCEGDACQGLPEAPEDPTPGTLVQSGAPAASPPKAKQEKRRKKKHHKHKRRKGRGAR